MANYGLLDNQWALIFAMVTFATPYAIWMLVGYSASIPYELDEAARVDGATVTQIFFRIYLPLLTPAADRSQTAGTYARGQLPRQYGAKRPSTLLPGRMRGAPPG